jgi:hypothetical protein
MSKRTRRRSGKSSRWLYAFGGLVIAGIVLILLMPMLVMNWVRGYLQEEAFRDRLEQAFGSQMQAQVTLSPLRWTGDEVTATEAGLSTATGWQARLNGLHTTLDWNAFRQGKWRTVGTGVDSITMARLPQPQAAAPAPARESTPPPDGQISDTDSAIPAWLHRYLPSSTEVDGIRVDRFTLLHPGPWNLRDARVRLSTWRQGETSLQGMVEGGIVETPLMLPAQTVPMKLNLSRASLRLSAEDLHLKEATLTWLETTEITARGHLRPLDGTWEGSASITGIPMRECLTEDWRIRLSGKLEASLKARGDSISTPVISGRLNLREGVLTALPILDQLASYTGVERFKRIVLDTATAEVTLNGSRRQFDKVILQSNGLLYLDGNLVVEGELIEGNFLLGVTPETLKWIPGAQQHVFTSTHPAGPAGMLWTPLRITGSIQSPKEDLSSRLAAAAGKAVLDGTGQIVGQGSELLLTPVLGKDAAVLPGAVIKEATDTTGKAVETGVKLLEGIGGGLLGR